MVGRYYLLHPYAAHRLGSHLPAWGSDPEDPHAMIEVLQAHGLCPHSYCYFCKRHFEMGDYAKLYCIKVTPRYGKDRKKLKGDSKEIRLKIHANGCPGTELGNG